MDSKLQRYLNDHLAGSAGAVDLLQSICDAQDEPEEARYFREQKSKVEEERRFLKGLIEKLGKKDSTLLQAAGKLTGKASKLKLLWEGFEPGRLGMFEALEILAAGIQAKRLLWVVLREIAPWIPEWEGCDFEKLEKEALAQRDAVEGRRIEAGVAALVEPERRAAGGLGNVV